MSADFQPVAEMLATRDHRAGDGAPPVRSLIIVELQPPKLISTLADGLFTPRFLALFTKAGVLLAMAWPPAAAAQPGGERDNDESQGEKRGE